MPPIYTGAVRTPFGRYGGALAKVRPDDLAAHALRALLDRAPGLDPAAIDDVILGDANGAGEDNRDVARMAVLLAGLPTSVPGATVNRLCGSSLEAAIQAARAIETGDADDRGRRRRGVDEPRAVGAAEARARLPRRPRELFSTTLGWRMVNPEMPARVDDRLGESRREAGRPSTASPARSRTSSRCAATRSPPRPGTRAATTPRWCRCPGSTWRRDEGIRADTSLEKLAKLKPVFARAAPSPPATPRRSTTAPRCCCSAPRRRRSGSARAPLARVVSRGVHGVDPDVFGIAPVEAANEALAPRRDRLGDVDAVELNEAFASQSLACLAGWPDLDPAKVNLRGGAIAIGHPLGASGARVLGRAVDELRARGGRYGLATLCIGVGQGLAMVVERVAD